ALAQCSNFLVKHPHIKIIEEGDTASCVKNIHDKNLRNTAAVANRVASALYNVPVLSANIEDNSENFTRFFLLSKGNLKPENPNKASLCFRVKHHIGSLSEVLTVMKKNNVNLSKIQSVPVLGRRSEYSFHIDVEWSKYGDFQKAVKQIKDDTTSFSILGEYVKANI
nr:prephenate dehydratase [Bacteroidota bacterium]